MTSAYYQIQILIGLDFSLYLGCLESLVYYKQLLAAKHLHVNEDKAGAVRAECLAMLKTLGNVDPYRVRRYQELGMFSNLSSKSSL